MRGINILEGLLLRTDGEINVCSLLVEALHYWDDDSGRTLPRHVMRAHLGQARGGV